MSDRPIPAPDAEASPLAPRVASSSREKPLVDLYFVDVAQGTSQVIQAGSHIVIIDCGEFALPILDLLDKLTFETIDIVISHWHKDHVGGLVAILYKYKDKIQLVHFPQTRSAEELSDIESFDDFAEFIEKQDRIKADRLVSEGADPYLFSSTINETEVRLTCLFPSYLTSIRLQQSSDENAGSGVLLLECGSSKVLFPGDVGKIGLERIRQRYSSGSILECSICAAPHHTGRLGSGPACKGYDTPYDWLYHEVVKPEYLIVSVGTTNKNRHPNPRHIEAAKKHPIKIMCTQITKHCVPRPSVYKPAILGDCHASSSCYLGHGVGCAGTIHVELFRERFDVKSWAQPQLALDKLPKDKPPLCRLPVPSERT